MMDKKYITLNYWDEFFESLGYIKESEFLNFLGIKVPESRSIKTLEWAYYNADNFHVGVNLRDLRHGSKPRLRFYFRGYSFGIWL